MGKSIRSPRPKLESLPFVAQQAILARQQTKAGRRQQELRPGSLCPQCQDGQLDYDGTLNLSCQRCGYTLSGGGGCT